MKKRVVLGQLGWAYDDEVWLPTAAGALAAHCLASADFRAAYEIDPWLRYEREEPTTLVDEIGTPTVVALSHYVWNEQLNYAVLREVKARWPGALTVLGGPSVGDAGPLAEQLLREHPEVDVLVHGEGEETFRTLLTQRLVAEGAPCAGTSHLTPSGVYVAAPTRDRRKNLDDFPSPFLAGVFDETMRRAAAKGQRFSAVWEPDRGCVFSCTFCRWGGPVGVKLNTFGMERLKAELEWFAEKQIAFLYGASANFGMLFDRDYALAEHMAALKRTKGYPQRMMVNTSKNATERVFQLSKLLHDAGLSKGATLSMQSWNDDTLVAIGRNNIKGSTYAALQQKFREAGIPTYSELILGLPGETLDSFCAGIDKNLDAGQHDGLFVYLCRVLPGTEMADPAYRQEHGIQTVRLPIQANHGSLSETQVGPTEYEETVIATATMSHEDWLEAQRIAWFVQVFFVLGIARLPLLWLRAQGVAVTDFARWALRTMGDSSYEVLGAERERLERYLVSQDAGLPVVPVSDLGAFPAIRWPLEEASWLALMSRKEVTYAELLALLEAFCTERGLDPLSVVVTPNMRALKHWTDGQSPSDPAEFARQVLWFGRRGSSMLHAPP